MATKVFLNPDNLKKAIKGLRDKADNAGRARAAIDSESERLGDPSPSKAVDTFCVNTATHIDAVRERADEIEREMNRIIELNENGLASKDDTGVITVQVPDTVIQGGVNDFNTWSQGVLDGKDLETVLSGGSPKSGRNYKDITTSMAANQNSDSYSRGVVDTIGPENLTRLPLDANTYFYNEKAMISSYPNSGKDLAAMLGTLLANASHTWNDAEAREAAENIYSSVNQEGRYGRITVLNSMMAGHDANGDYINDLKFSTKFLDELAPRLEKIDWEKVQAYAEKAHNDPRYCNSTIGDLQPYMLVYPGLGQILSDRSFDPMAGVLDAMGNNPDAALEFLAPAQDGAPGIADTTRLKELTERWRKGEENWDSAGFAGLSAAVAAASTKRTSATAAESSRADTLSDDAIHSIAKNVGTGFYGDLSKARLGMLIANCSGEVTGSWSAEGGNGQLAATNKVPFESTAEDLNALVYRVIDDPSAAATISAGLADYAQKESQRGLENNKNGSNDVRLQGIKEAYGNATEAVSHLQGLAEIRAEDLTEKKAANASAAKESSSTALNVFETVLSTGIGTVSGPAGTAASTAFSIGTTLFNPIIVDSATGDAGKAEAVTSKVPADMGETIWAAAVQDAANAGLLQQSDFSTPVAQKDASGNDVKVAASDHYDWIVPKPGGGYTIDLSKGGDDAIDQVNTWAEVARNPNADRTSGEAQSPPADQSLTDLKPDGKAGDGKAAGESAGRYVKENGG